MGTCPRGQIVGAEGSSQAVASEDGQGIAGRSCRWLVAGVNHLESPTCPTAGHPRRVGQVAQRGEDSDGGSGERQTRGLSSPPGQRGECCSKDRTRWKADNRHWREARREKSSGVVPPSVRV